MNSTRSLILFYAQLLVIATLPFPLLASSYATVILLLAFLYNLYRSASFRDEVWGSFVSNRIAQMFLLIFATYLVSGLLHHIINSGKPFQFSEIEQILSFLVFPFLYANVKAYDDKRIKNFFNVYIISIVASTLIALSTGLYYTINTGSIFFYDSEKLVVFNNFMYHRLGSYVGMHAVYYAEYVLLAFIMWVSFVYSHYSSWSIKLKAFGIFLALYLIGIIFLLQSAAILIVLLLIICLFTAYSFYKAKETMSKSLRVLIAAVSILMVVILANRATSKIGSKADFFTYDLSQPGGGEWNGVNLRLAKWHIAQKAIKDNWLIGVGPGYTTSTLDSYYEKIGFDYALQMHYNPHNQVLQTFLTLGIIGIAILLAIFVILFRNSLNRKDSVMFLFVLSFLLFSMSESTLAVNKGIVFFSIFSCFFCYLPKKSSAYLNAL